MRTLFAELMFKAESMVKHWFLRKWTTIERNKVSLRRLKVSVKKECFVLVVLSIMSTSLTHFALHWNTLKELDSALKEFSYGGTRRCQQICWFWTDLERSRLFFPCWCCFYSIIEAHSQIKHCKKEGGMQRVTSILSEDVGLGEILGMFRFFRATSTKVMTSERNSSAAVVFDSNLFKRVRLLVLTQNSKTPRA